MGGSADYCCDGKTQLLRPTITTSIAKKQLNLPRKVSNGCDSVVDHSSDIPRKLRSVMRKRSCKHNSVILLNPKRLNHSMNDGSRRAIKKKGSSSPKKKSKLNLTGHNQQDYISPKQASTATISKDEEEVAETLFALAGMIPDNDMINSADNNCLSPPRQVPAPAPPDAFTNQEDSVIATFEGTTNSSQTKKGSSPEYNDSMDEGSSKVLILPSQTKLTQCSVKLSLNNTNAPHSPVNFPVYSKTQDLNINQTQDSICLPAELTLERSNDQLGQDEALGCAQTTRDNKGETGGFQNDQKHCKSGKEDSGSKLSPCLNLRISHGGEAGEHSSKFFSSANYPSWLTAKVSCSKARAFPSHETAAPQVKASERKKTRRRCTTHVYVSNLIRSLRISEGGSVRPYEEVNDLNSSSGELRRVGLTLTSHHLHGSLAEKCCIEASNSNSVVAEGVSQEQGAFRNLTPTNQQFDFLSLSLVKYNPPKVKSDEGVLLDPPSELLPIHQLNPAARNGFVSSLSNLASHLPLSHHQHTKPSTFAHSKQQKSPQVHVPSYFRRPLGPAAQAGHNSDQLIDHPPQAQHDLQKRPPPSEYQNPAWVAQVPSSYYRSSGVQFMNWKNNNGGRQDPCLVQYIQSRPLLLPPTYSPGSSLRGQKYLSLSQPNNQQEEGLSSLPPLPQAREYIPSALWL